MARFQKYCLKSIARPCQHGETLHGEVVTTCSFQRCFSCIDGPRNLDRTTAALRSLELAQGNVHTLCDQQPPFMHLERVRELIADATCNCDWRPLQKEVSGVFSNAIALSCSFIQSDAERQYCADALQVPLDSTSGIDTGAIPLPDF